MGSKATQKNSKKNTVVSLTTDVNKPTQSADLSNNLQIENILERISDSFVALDTNWVYTYVNEKAANMFGRTREQLIGKHIWNEFPEGVGQPFYKAYYKAVETQQPIFLEEYYPPYDRWFENRIYPSKEGLSIFFHDVTDRKKAELELQETERRFREMLEKVKLIVVLLDLEGHVTFCNEFLLQLTEYTRDEVLGCDWFAKFIPDVRPDVKEIFLQGLSQGELVSSFENQIRTKSNNARFIHFTNTIMRDSQGKIIGTASLGEDITNNKQEEQKLRELQDLFFKAFHVGPAGMTITRISDGKFINANASFCKMFEFDLDEVIGHTSTELNMWTSEERKKLIQKQIESGGLNNFELIAQSKSGNPINLLFSSRELDINEESCHLTTLIDITDQKRTEDLLRKSEKRFKLLFEHSTSGIVICQLVRDGTGKAIDYIYLQANESLYRHVGIKPKEVLGKLGSEVVSREETAILVEKFDMVVKTGIPHEYQQYLPTFNKTIDMQIVHLEEDFFAVVFFDVTERIQLEENLRLSESKYKLISENAYDWIYWISPDLTFRYCSPSCERITGYSVQEFTSNPRLIEKIVHPDDAEMLHKMFIDIKKEDRNDLEFRIIAKNGNVRWISHSYKQIFAQDGEYLGQRGTNRDVTDRKKAQEEIIRLNAELEERVIQRTSQLTMANKELESFSYSVSHDLRAPLRAISGFASIIARRHRPDLNEEGQHYVDNIVLASERMGFLIDDLLTYSRLGREGIRHLPIPLTRVLIDIVKNFQNRIDESHGRITIAESFPTIIGDQTLVDQIFTNLLENAITYHKTNIPPKVNVDWKVNGNDVIVTVCDNGIGIPPEFLEKVFNMFQRLHSEDEYPGTGIGLANVKKSVELLGGSVWVESKVGEGSNFFIRLPKE